MDVEQEETYLTFIMEYENYSFPEAIEVSGRPGWCRTSTAWNIRTKPEEKAARSEEQDLLRSIQMAAKYYYYQLRTENSDRSAIEYLTGRELSDETIQKFGLGYSDKYQR